MWSPPGPDNSHEQSKKQNITELSKRRRQTFEHVRRWEFAQDRGADATQKKKESQRPEISYPMRKLIKQKLGPFYKLR